MSFFSKIFGENDGEKSLKPFWTEIKTEEDLDLAIQKSFQQKIAIFKHSTSCFISKTVLRNFEKEVESIEADGAKLYYLDLLAHRNISNKIAELFNVRHQSPQLLVIDKGEAVSNASHEDITYTMI